VVTRVVVFSRHPHRSSLCPCSPFMVARKSLPLTSLAAPHLLTPIESHPYKNHGEAGVRFIFSLALLRSFVALCTKSVSQLFRNQLLPHSFPKMPVVTQQFPFWNSQFSILKDRRSSISYTYKCPLPQLLSFDILTNARGGGATHLFSTFKRSNALFASRMQLRDVQRSVACRQLSERSTIGCLHIQEGTRYGHC
jgi:hypothetical protein